MEPFSSPVHAPADQREKEPRRQEATLRYKSRNTHATDRAASLYKCTAFLLPSACNISTFKTEPFTLLSSLCFVAMKLFSARKLSFLLPLLLTGMLLSSFFQMAAAQSDFCKDKCKVRCSKASVQDGCLKYCGICCATCNCVPSGTYGNKDECPCYRDWYTGEGKRRRPKCP